MALDRQRIQHYLDTCDFRTLFIEELGWDHCRERPCTITVDTYSYLLCAVAQKRGMIVYTCDPDATGSIPERRRRERIEQEIARIAYEHVIIYIDALHQQHLWQWVRREPGKLHVPREFSFHKGRSYELFLQRLQSIAFTPDEEDSLGIAEVAQRARQAFDIDRVTKRFYDHFEKEHAAFLEFIQGIVSQIDREWYASLMLNRLMFVYFIQKKGFLDNNTSYLPDKLKMMQERRGKDTFLTFYRHFLLRLFHEGLNKERHRRTPDLDELLGDVPYLNGGLFERHELERDNSTIHIPDEAFERIFAFFDSYQWQINEQPLRYANEINPDVIGHIFEKYINQKQMGAYYTKEDITEYISKSTIIPFLFAAVEQASPVAFELGGPIWQLLRLYPDRYIAQSVRTGEYLPTETEREYSARRSYYVGLRARLQSGAVHTVHDCITYNLDLCQFAQDVLWDCTDAHLLRIFYEQLATIAILDPTCGSGAFLFAALNILQLLYEACLERMRVIVADVERYGDMPSVEDISFFRETLGQVDKHQNPTYFILKAIAINNLYGVDIMKEATEICKLRLFLKLVAQLHSPKEIEPLPDIDFNIRSGNTLVGFANYDEVKKAVLGDLQAKMDFEQVMARIEQKAQVVEWEFAQFRALQTREGSSPDDIRDRKNELRSVLKELRSELDRYLASEYGIDRLHKLTEQTYKPAFEQWQLSHSPFHWFVEFYGIMQRGGFDVIIGNPPYVEYSKVRKDYTVHGYETENCGNLYAAVLERSLTLCRPEHSYVGLIVPLSVCGGERFEQLRATIRANTSALWLANFEIFPSRLFDGAFQRLSILTAEQRSAPHRSLPATHVTRIQRWYAIERPHLLPLITYTPTSCIIKPDVFPKLASLRQEAVLRKVFEKARGNTIAASLSPRRTTHFVYYQEATNYWTKATCRVPFYRKNGVEMEPAHGRFLFFRDEITACTVMALMNSSLFYLWFATYSDGFHLSHTLVKEFPVAKELYELRELSLLSIRLEEDIRAHVRMSTRNTQSSHGQKKGNDLIEIEEYRMGQSKVLLDEIDAVLAQYYHFTDDELEFIIHYDSKYRLGRENG
jgi:hypothetical protein